MLLRYDVRGERETQDGRYSPVITTRTRDSGRAPSTGVSDMSTRLSGLDSPLEASEWPETFEVPRKSCCKSAVINGKGPREDE